MPARFVNIDRDTPLLLPPNLKDWVAANHLCLFIVDAVEELNLREVKGNERGTGSSLALSFTKTDAGGFRISRPA
jgi:hypothetical protein